MTRFVEYPPLRKATFLLAAASSILTACGAFGQLFKVVVAGDSRTLRERPSGQPSNAPSRPALLILAIDGIGRDLLYSMLGSDELPELAALIGKSGSSFPHAYFAPDVLTTVPSTTGVAWATIFTGVSPAEHGFAGNEFFIRETKQFAAPIPVSVHASAEALSVFTEGYANKFLSAPTIYELMRERDPYVNIWVSMSQFYRGADQLLMTRRSAIAAALEAFLEGYTDKNLPRSVWADLDEEDIDVVVERLGKEPLPDVLTIYLFGTDDWAHISPQRPAFARKNYMKEVIDPAIGTLRKRLLEKNALDNRYVILVSDHGHTQVMKDDVHALSNKDANDPPAVLRKAGYRVRPFEAQVKDSDPFQSVLAYQGAIAYVYLADRSSCADGSSPCDWTRPPRYRQDVLPAADGAHPHPTYVAVAERLRDLAVGLHGERAGDVLLLAHNGDRDRPEDRFYFATPYHSWHGSPSEQDSRIPLVVAHAKRSTAALQATVRSYLGQNPRAQAIGALLVGLREGKAGTKTPVSGRPPEQEAAPSPRDK